jgi:hypothetical protein
LSAARRGYLYFRLDPSATAAQRETVRTEWADLNAVAGKGQVVGFGNWGYIGGFSGHVFVRPLGMKPEDPGLQPKLPAQGSEENEI